MNCKSLARALPGFSLALYVVGATVGSFCGGLWASLAIGGALILYGGAWMLARKMPRCDRTPLLFTCLFLCAAALLNLQAAYPPLSWAAELRVATIMLPLCLWFSPQLQTHIYSPRFFPALVIAAAIGALALGSELFFNGPLLRLVKGATAGLTEYNRGASYLVILSFPLLAYLWHSGRRWEMVAFAGVVLFPASVTDSRATKMAFLLGIGAIVAARIMPVLTYRLLCALTLLLAAWPFAVTRLFDRAPAWMERLPPSWQHRSEIWDYMSYRLFERPLWGWGIGSSHSLPFAQPHGNLYHYVTVNAPHPHNAILQLWVELGLPGLLFGLGAALYVLKQARNLPPAIAPYAIGAWVAALSICLVAYDFWNDSLFSIFAMTVVAFTLLARQSNVRSPVITR